MSNLPPSNSTRHKVLPGEVLSAIAEQHGIDLDALLAANPDITDPDFIRAGQVIIIPNQAVTDDEPGNDTEPLPGSSAGSATVNTNEETGNIFLGFDRLEYPGDEFMGLLRSEAQVSWTGFYLAPAASQGSTTWMKKRDFLAGLGFGFAPIYVGQQEESVKKASHILTAEQGKIDGKNAVELAQRAGFPEQSVLYLDIETGSASHELQQYYKAWVQGVGDNGFTPGVYCSHLLPPTLLQQATAVIWIFHLKFNNGRSFAPPLPMIDPSDSTFTEARMMQYAQQGKLTLGGQTLNPIDLDSSHKADPSEV